MNYIIGLIAVFILLYGVRLERSDVVHELEKEEFVFPEMDKALINVWHDCKELKIESMQKNINGLLATWSDAQSEMNEMQIRHFNIEYFKEEIDYLINLVDLNIEYGRYESAGLYAYHILWKFKEARYLFTDIKYPVDRLVEIIDIQNEIGYIINDQRMGLYEWKEFIDLVEDLKYEISYYQKFDLINVSKYFSARKMMYHKEQLNKVNQKLIEFDDSLNSRFRTDFILPSENLEKSILNLLKSYSQVQIAS